jgi:hypothetical protein
LEVSISASQFYEHSQRQKEPEFAEKYAARACIEWKNGEMKRFHGMSRARGFGLAGVQTQIKLTAIAVNLKRIACMLTCNEKDRIKNVKDTALKMSFTLKSAILRPCSALLRKSAAIWEHADFRLNASA